MTSPDDRGAEPDPDFAPCRDRALARLAAVDPPRYARSRNHLQGAVTRLSPYLSHGVLSLAEVVQHLRQHHRLGLDHKLVQELGWRAYFHHCWRLGGEAIFRSAHPGPLPESAYCPELPADIRQGATGVPAIDQAVRQLYASGWLHNHARLWLASYVVHLRKVHWRAGADWLYGHLLDGDLASNHLSWQWVAGTRSHKPYLFNADNVARFAPPAWHSPGSAIDQHHEALDALARNPRPLPGGQGQPVAEPPLWNTPPPGLVLPPPTHNAAPAPARSPDAAEEPVWLHAWSVGWRAEAPARALLLAGFHRRWAWSERRWRWVTDALSRRCGTPPLWLTQADTPLQGPAQADPHLNTAALPSGLHLTPPPSPWPEPAQACASFSQYWRAVARLQAAAQRG